MADQEQNNSGGFSKTTNFKWLAVGIALFTVIGFVIPTPTSMIEKAAAMGQNLSADQIAANAKNVQIIIALLSACVIFFATEAIPMPAVALLIGPVSYTHLRAHET